MRALKSHLEYNPRRSLRRVNVRRGATALSPAEPPFTHEPSDESESAKTQTADNWVLTKEALDKLLACFSPDRDEAARKYELMRTKVIRYFEWKSVTSPEDKADVTINRVARKIDEGKTIYNLPGYFRRVSELVFLESSRERHSVTLDDVQEIPDDPPLVDDQKEARLLCLDKALDNLPIESRNLILDYYRGETRAKIEHRRQLADVSSMNALRIRACRLRKKLEKSVKQDLERMLSRNESGSGSS